MEVDDCARLQRYLSGQPLQLEQLALEEASGADHITDVHQCLSDP